MDIVTVFHNDTNRVQADQLRFKVELYADTAHTFTAVDNTRENRGFGPACNLGASEGTGRIIGFLNPDLVIVGPFMHTVEIAFDHDPALVITGERFGKPLEEIVQWGCNDWVCGAAFFVRRTFFELMRGFDEQFVWAWEETDLIRRAVAHGMLVRSIPLPFNHSSPTRDSLEDSAYKAYHFDRGAKLFRQKWGS